MSAFDALAVWSAVEFQANRARLSAVQMRVLHAIVNQTVRYQRLSVRISRSRMARLADVHGNNLAPCLDALEETGFISHAPGAGRRLTVVTLVVPEHWEQHEEDAEGDLRPHAEAPASTVAGSATSTVAEVTTPTVVNLATPDVATSATSTVAGTATSDVAHPATGTGRGNEKRKARSEDGEGPHATVVTLRAVPDAPSPSLDASASAEDVANSFFEAMKQAGAPVVNTRQVIQGIRDALKAGYDPNAVMLGLGYWVAEGEMYPRQIGERCQRAVLAGGPPKAVTVEALLREGSQRHVAALLRRQPPTSKAVREATTMETLARWERKDVNPWS